jgi:hypothetical protein
MPVRPGLEGPWAPARPSSDVAARRRCEADAVRAWRTADQACTRAYEAWCAAPVAAKQHAYAAYLAAADRERRAADALCPRQR